MPGQLFDGITILSWPSNGRQDLSSFCNWPEGGRVLSPSSAFAALANDQAASCLTASSLGLFLPIKNSANGKLVSQFTGKTQSTTQISIASDAFSLTRLLREFINFNLTRLAIVLSIIQVASLK